MCCLRIVVLILWIIVNNYFSVSIFMFLKIFFRICKRQLTNTTKYVANERILEIIKSVYFADTRILRQSFQR